MHDAERTVVTKPVAIRPCSSFRSFSELLTGAVNASLPIFNAETTVAIRPKTVRFKPPPSHSPDDVSEAAVCHLSDKASVTTLRADCRSCVVYKPMAKVVSRTAASLLANGNDISNQQTLEIQVPDQIIHHQPTSSLPQNMPSCMDVNGTYEPYINEHSTLLPPNAEQDIGAPQPTSNGDRPSSDGYNWRKYGQKQVKKCEYPRSYYKCTHPNCPVKKKVERSLDGQIAEIVYKAEHNHPKPQPPKRLSLGSQGQACVSDGHGIENSNPLSSDPLIGRNEFEGGMDNNNEVISLLGAPFHGNMQCCHDSFVAAVYDSGVKIPETSVNLGEGGEVGSRAADVENGKPKYKRRKKDDLVSGAGALKQAITHLHSSEQTSTESDVLGDGFRWRKYGQKVVKGNAYPRCYYKCTSLKCNVRKYVERASVDPRSFVTTYEGKHNHDMPDRKM